MGPVGKEKLETGELVADKRVGLVVGSVGHMVAGMDHRAVADKQWEEGNYWLGFADTGHHASLAAWAFHREVEGKGH